MFSSILHLPDPASVLADAGAPAWVRSMRDCEQDARWHPEGDVLAHTLLVLARLDELLAQGEQGHLDEADRAELRWAAALHDVGKPATSRLDEMGAHTTFGHAKAGSMIARGILWRHGLDPAVRERICGLVRWHMLPGHLLSRDNPRFALALASQSCRLDDLTLLAHADTLGRGDGGDLGEHGNLAAALDRVSLFRLAAEDESCYTQPYPFASDHARVVYFEHEGQREPYDAYDGTRATLHVMHALPGVGKDTYIAEHLSSGTHHISIDAWRQKLGLEPGEFQVSVPVAMNELRAGLRTGTDCVFNATSLIRDHRAKVIRLGREYGYRTRIVQLETTPQAQKAQNASREMAVPADVIDKMLTKWEAPTLAECHELSIIDCSERRRR